MKVRKRLYWNITEFIWESKKEDLQWKLSEVTALETEKAVSCLGNTPLFEYSKQYVRSGRWTWVFVYLSWEFKPEYLDVFWQTSSKNEQD